MSFDKYKTKGAYHYDWYKTEAWYKACVDRCVEFAKGDTLDVGCGDGLVCRLIKDNGYPVMGVDNNGEGLNLANEKCPDIEFMLNNIEEPLSGKWEYMVCLNVIEHLKDPEAIKRIFNRNITKAAIIITDFPQEHPSPYHVKEFTPYELKQMFHTRKVKAFKIDDNFHGIEVYK